MKKWQIFRFLIIALIVFPWLPAIPVQAGSKQVSFSALDATCSVTPGAQWISRDVLHVRGEVDNKRMASANSLVNGTNTVITNYDINLSNGNGSGWGTFVLRPDNVNGAWTGGFAGYIAAGVFSGHGTASGTGTLTNWKLTAGFQGITVPANQPCPGPASDADQIQGSILSLP